MTGEYSGFCRLLPNGELVNITQGNYMLPMIAEIRQSVCIETANTSSILSTRELVLRVPKDD